MSEIHPELIEKYQLMLEKDPKAKVFAPLAEAYRKMGLKKEALTLCRSGVQHNPHFAGGRVALAKLLLEEQHFEEAAQELHRATELSPENILAQSLLADTCLKLRRPKEALKAYKMVLLLNPQSDKAQKAVQKLESLTADEFDEELFAMKPLTQAFSEALGIQRGGASTGASPSAQDEAPQLRPLGLDEMERKERKDLERLLSLADAYVVRNDMEKALEALQELQRLYGLRPEVKKRLQLIHQRQDRETEEVAQTEPPPLSRPESLRKKRVEYLQRVLRRLQNMS